MRRRLAVALLLFGSVGMLGTTGVAVAEPDIPGGCPQGYVAFDRQVGEGVPPAYEQGERVVASGVLIDTSAGVPEVTLRSGSPDGPELGRAAVAADGSWQGLAFAVPEEIADGEYRVYLVARDRHGVMLSGLPYPFLLRVGPPVATQSTPVTQDASDEPSRDEGESVANAMAKDVRSALRESQSTRSQPAEGRRSVAQTPAAVPARSVAPTAAPAQATPVGTGGPSTTTSVTRPAVTRRTLPSGSSRRESTSPVAPSAPKPAPFTVAPSPAAGAVAPSPDAGARSLDRSTPSGETASRIVGSLLTLLAACGLTGYFLRRRRPPQSARAIVEPVIVPPYCPVEAELQAMVDEGITAEDHDPIADREPEREPALA